MLTRNEIGQKLALGWRGYTPALIEESPEPAKIPMKSKQMPKGRTGYEIRSILMPQRPSKG